MGEGRDIHLPNESGVVDPRLAPHVLAQKSLVDAYQRRETKKVATTAKPTIARRLTDAYRTLTKGR